VLKQPRIGQEGVTMTILVGQRIWYCNTCKCVLNKDASAGLNFFRIFCHSILYGESPQAFRPKKQNGDDSVDDGHNNEDIGQKKTTTSKTRVHKGKGRLLRSRGT
jgi:hypothetical protein